MSKTEAISRLIEMGAVNEKKEDSSGQTKAGWWLDQVWLAPSSRPQDALAAIAG